MFEDEELWETNGIRDGLSIGEVMTCGGLHAGKLRRERVGG